MDIVMSSDNSPLLNLPVELVCHIAFDLQTVVKMRYLSKAIKNCVDKRWHHFKSTVPITSAEKYMCAVREIKAGKANFHFDQYIIGQLAPLYILRFRRPAPLTSLTDAGIQCSLEAFSVAWKMLTKKPHLTLQDTLQTLEIRGMTRARAALFAVYEIVQSIEFYFKRHIWRVLQSEHYALSGTKVIDDSIMMISCYIRYRTHGIACHLVPNNDPEMVRSSIRDFRWCETETLYNYAALCWHYAYTGYVPRVLVRTRQQCKIMLVWLMKNNKQGLGTTHPAIDQCLAELQSSE